MSSLRPIARFDKKHSIHHHVDGRVQARKHNKRPQEGYNKKINNITIAGMYKPEQDNHEGAVNSVNRDLYGIHHGTKVKDPTESINPDRARSTVETELYNIPIDLRSVYIEASVRAPLLLVTDSDPVMFMRAEDMKAEVSDFTTNHHRDHDHHRCPLCLCDFVGVQFWYTLFVQARAVGSCVLSILLTALCYPYTPTTACHPLFGNKTTTESSQEDDEVLDTTQGNLWRPGLLAIDAERCHPRRSTSSQQKDSHDPPG